MTQKEIEETADEFWEEAEKEAAKLEVTLITICWSFSVPDIIA